MNESRYGLYISMIGMLEEWHYFRLSQGLEGWDMRWLCNTLLAREQSRKENTLEWEAASMPLRNRRCWSPWFMKSRSDGVSYWSKHRQTAIGLGERCNGDLLSFVTWRELFLPLVCNILKKVGSIRIRCPGFFWLEKDKNTNSFCRVGTEGTLMDMAWGARTRGRKSLSDLQRRT